MKNPELLHMRGFEELLRSILIETHGDTAFVPRYRETWNTTSNSHVQLAFNLSIMASDDRMRLLQFGTPLLISRLYKGTFVQASSFIDRPR